MTDSKSGVVIDMNDSINTVGTLAFDSTLRTLYPSTASVSWGLNIGQWANVPLGHSVLSFAVGDVVDPRSIRFVVGGAAGTGFSCTTAATHMVMNGASASIQYNTNQTITSLSRTGSTVTVNKVAHGYADQDVVQFNSNIPSDMDGAYVITKINNDSLSYTSAGAAGAASPPGSMSTNAVLANDSIYFYQTYNGSTFDATMKAVTTSGVVRIDMSTNSNVGLIEPSQITRIAGMKFYGWAVFYFAVMPSAAELSSALEWMAANWRAGNRYIYPAWVGRT